jgi:DNA-binding MarR family transcriptional regulator
MNTPRTTGSLVWHLALKWRAEVDRAIIHLGLTHAEYSVLASLHVLASNGSAPTQRELADYAGLQAIYISKLVRSLEADGHISRSADAVDTRAYRLALTDTGRNTITAARDIVRELDRRLTEPLGGPDGQRTKDLAAMLSLLLDQPRISS